MKTLYTKSYISNKSISNTAEVDWRYKSKSANKHDRPAVFIDYTNQINHYIKQGNSNETY